VADRIWFITGASTGFGRALAEEALDRGDRVAATARDPRALDDLVARHPRRVCAIALDVTSPEQVEVAVQAAVDEFGRIDVAVNNAGYLVIGAIEEVSDAEARMMFDTHVFGALSIIKSVVPFMRRRGSGTIVNMSSIGGLCGYAGGGIYSSCKFALEGLSEAMEEELAPFGVRVLLVEPGTYRTDFFSRSLRLAEPLAEYAGTVVDERRVAVQVDPNLLPPARLAATAIVDAVGRPDQPLRVIIGDDALDGARAKCERLSQEIDHSSYHAKQTAPKVNG
jgi:NAD(P)-dependent dehydrogenase (short-subunit alcohol dehydrogenase family)